MNYTAVITTINEPTKGVKEVAARMPLIIISDEKTPNKWYCDDIKCADFISSLNYTPPTNHYARKNLGYLIAMQRGADCIYDTDDDNIPNEKWKLRTLETSITHTSNQDWCNVYEPLTSGNIWPRGFPLNRIKEKAELKDVDGVVTAPIQQGLADESPDVDAIWRLTNGRMVNFWLPKRMWLKNTWCPFNSQTTWWFKEAFPLMYLPQYCTMRMTDIIRSFVAQRCLWEMGYGVVFHSPSEVVQERNEHDLMKDFEDEIQGYLMNDKIKIALDGLELGDRLVTNIYKCYSVLINLGIVPYDELKSLDQWLNDVQNICKP